MLITLFQRDCTRSCKLTLNLHKSVVKSVSIWSFSGPHFPAFEQNKEIEKDFLRIHSKLGKIQTRKTPGTESFYALKVS